jgi:hypothetical protein
LTEKVRFLAFFASPANQKERQEKSMTYFLHGTDLAAFEKMMTQIPRCGKEEAVKADSPKPGMTAKERGERNE